MLPNGNIPKLLSSKARCAGRHHTKKRYPPEQASGAGRPTLVADRGPHQAKRCHAAHRAARSTMFISAPKITPSVFEFLRMTALGELKRKPAQSALANF